MQETNVALLWLVHKDSLTADTCFLSRVGGAPLSARIRGLGVERQSAFTAHAETDETTW